MVLEKILNHPDSSLSAVSSPSYQLSRVPLIDENILQCTPSLRPPSETVSSA